jgi:Secretion system C-terminal sorting domain
MIKMRQIQRYAVVVMLTMCMTPLFAQRNDYVWLGGYRSIPGSLVFQDSVLDKCYGITRLDFNYSPKTVTFDSMTMSFERSIISYSDSMGKLLFYSNGYQIRNRWDELVEHGDTMNYDFTSYYDTSYYKYGMLGSGAGIMALPISRNQDSFMFFYNGIDYRYYQYQFRCALLDMSANGGHGRLVYRDRLLGAEVSSGAIGATRHANGRDWWVISQTDHTPTFYRILLHEHGGMEVDSNLIGLFKVFGPDTGMTGGGQFSPDGSMYAYADNVSSVLYLYDFDRCSGQFTNMRYWHRPDVSFQFALSSAVFSPDSRMLYVNRDSVMFQFDTHASDVWGSMDTIAVYTSTGDPDYFRSEFGRGQLGPDGKIYISHGLGSLNYDIIDSPNAKGAACHFLRHGLLARSHYGGLPNFPNHRLGKAAAPCTVGIEEVNGTPLDIALIPNPAQSMVTVDYASIDWMQYNSMRLTVTDMLGQQVYQYELPRFSALHRVDVSGYTSGMYFVTLTSPQGRILGVRKLVRE